MLRLGLVLLRDAIRYKCFELLFFQQCLRRHIMKTFQILTTTYERITIIADSLTEACKEVREAGYYVAKVYQVA